MAMWAGLAIWAFIQTPSAAPPAGPAIECGLPFAITPIGRFADLPSSIRQDILKDGLVADRGEDFNQTDAILDRSLPYRQFVRAGTQGGYRWFVWLDHGGFDRHIDVVGYTQIQTEQATFEWSRSSELSGEPCAATNAILNGVRTDAHDQFNAGAIPRPAS